MKKHEIKLESKGLLHWNNGYRCSCGEGIASLSLKAAYETHNFCKKCSHSLTEHYWQRACGDNSGCKHCEENDSLK